MKIPGDGKLGAVKFQGLEAGDAQICRAAGVGWYNLGALLAAAGGAGGEECYGIVSISLFRAPVWPRGVRFGICVADRSPIFRKNLT